MKKIYLFFLLSNLFIQFSYSQNQLVKKWDRAFGGIDNEWIYSLQQTNDGGYILGGISHSDVSCNKTQPYWGPHAKDDYWIVKIDSLGNKQWDKDFGGTEYDSFRSLQQTRDGGYILGGYSNSPNDGNKTQASKGNYDYWIVKIDSLGNKEWDKDFGGIGDERLYSLQQTMDGGYILGGYSTSDSSGDKTQPLRGSADYWIIKIDSLGNKQWDKDFGGTKDDGLYSLQQTSDGGYIMGGTSNSGIGGDKTQPNWDTSFITVDYWIVKIDSLGNKEWDKNFGGTNNDVLSSLQQTIDGGYILGGISVSDIGGDKTQPTKGNTGRADYWIIKTDSLGNKQWDKVFGGIAGEDEFGNISQTTDGGYLLAGTSKSYASGDKSESNRGVINSWIVKTNLQGNKQWDKTLRTTGHDGGSRGIELKDGCYMFANYSYGVGGYGDKFQISCGQGTTGAPDYWIIKFCDTTTAAAPVSNFISSDTSFCDVGGKCVNFFDISSKYPSSWKWFFPGAVPDSSDQQNPTNICYTTPGTYIVTLIVTNAMGTDTLTVSPMIILGQTPPAPILFYSGDTITCSHAAFYQWYFNGNIIPSATDSFYIATQPGNYSVQITDSIGCSRLSNGVITSTNELSTESGIKIYSNPATTTLTVQLSETIKGKISFQIYDAVGRQVSTSPQSSSKEREYEINISHLSSGIYFLQMKSESGMVAKRFVKE